jgi:hypothetical protein
MKLRISKRKLTRKREPLATPVGKKTDHVGLAWYGPEDWAQLRATADDPTALDESYEAWLASAEKTLRSLRAGGVEVEKFPLDVATAAAWAKEQGRPFDSAARAAYVAEKMQKKERRT